MSKLSQVIPAILTDDPQALSKMVRQAETFATYVQFDIMDGQFVPSHSITHNDLAAMQIKLAWEAHLMVQHPDHLLADFKKAGAQKVICHYEATPSPRDTISKARQLGLKVGLAINPETPVSAIMPLVSDLDSVLFMTVHPGFYGSKFLPEVLDKVAELRQHHPDIEIGADGGLNETNIARVVQSGVDSVCVGSAIFLQPQPAESFRRLQALAQEASRHRLKSA